MTCKAVIFDYIGTLVNCKNYTHGCFKTKTPHSHWSLKASMLPKTIFWKHTTWHMRNTEKYATNNYKEVTNAIWVAEALCSLGFEVTADDTRVKAALNVFFQDFIDTLELREGRKKTG